MAIHVGLVGLPNTGKSTLFNALAAMQAASANFPFCTIEPNIGTALVPDERLTQLAQIYPSTNVLPTTLEFVDIAGLVKGAAKGEGLGNQFLGHIRAVDAIVHVVRCFDSKDIVHVYGHVDPVRDIEIVETELILKDLETLNQRQLRLEKTKQDSKEAAAQLMILKLLVNGLQRGNNARTLIGSDAAACSLAQELGLLTAKPVLFVANVAEALCQDSSSSPYVQALKHFVDNRQETWTSISAALEADIAQLNPSEQHAYLADYGLQETSLHKVIRQAYQLLNLVTFFTVGPKEARAWTIPRHTRAPQAAGCIHSDFERGFIRAEVISSQALLQHRSEAAVRAAGQLRVEGKEYIIQDGDVVHFRFNV